MSGRKGGRMRNARQLGKVVAVVPYFSSAQSMADRLAADISRCGETQRTAATHLALQSIRHLSATLTGLLERINADENHRMRDEWKREERS